MHQLVLQTFKSDVLTLTHAGFRLACCSPLCHQITTCCFRITAPSGHAALVAFSPSGIALKMNRIQLSVVCHCEQSSGVINLLAGCCLPLGVPSAASGSCAMQYKYHHQSRNAARSKLL